MVEPSVERQVIGALGYADIVDDEFSLPFGNNFANLVLDRLENGFGRLDAGAGRCAKVELDLATVDGGKEIAPGQRQHDGSQRDDQHSGDRDDEPPPEQQPEHFDVSLAQALEAAFEALVQPCKPASRAAALVMMLALEQ